MTGEYLCNSRYNRSARTGSKTFPSRPGATIIVEVHLDWTILVARTADFDLAPYPLHGLQARQQKRLLTSGCKKKKRSLACDAVALT